MMVALKSRYRFPELSGSCKLQRSKAELDRAAIEDSIESASLEAQFAGSLLVLEGSLDAPGKKSLVNWDQDVTPSPLPLPTRHV